MPKRGKSLERLVATIERVLRDDETIEVESPKRLADRTTGKLREHDVLLTITNGHHSILVAIECRDRSRPVGVPEIEAFWAKCQDTGVNQGIIVSPRGFRGSGRNKAEHLGIRCLDLAEAESFNWLLASGFLAIKRNLLGHDWNFFPETEGIVSRKNMEVIAPDGTHIDSAVLTANAQRILDQHVSFEDEPVNNREIGVRVRTEGIVLRNSESGETTSVRFAGVRVTYSITHELIPFRLSQYRDNDADLNITDVATADLQIGDKTGSIMVIYKEDEGGKVVFVPHSRKDA